MESIKEKVSKYYKKSLIYLFLISCVLFAIPSIIYMVQNKTVFEFEPYFKFLLNNTNRIDQTIIYIIILGLMTFFYWKVIKNRKNIFPTTKKMFIWIAIISIIFIAVLPFMCSDIFYYLGIGRLAGTYDQNPYYVTISDFIEQGNNKQLLETDTVLGQGYINDWGDTTVVYGPIWTLICQIIGAISFGNIDIGLLVFKIVNTIIHILNAYLIYKISNKKSFTLLYALNPFILIEGISSVHNDIFVVFFVLLALYFLVKKKKIIYTIIFLALATAIKYFTIILLPFVIIYYFRKENTKTRFIKCIEYGLIFLIVLIIPYLIYIQDMQVFAGLFTQQGKLAKSIYIIITEYFTSPEGLADTVKNTLLGIFTIIYGAYCIILLNKKGISFRKEMQNANYFIMFFLFFLITNFQPWYIMWLFPLIIWQKEENIKWIIQISLTAEFANSVFLAYSEGWQNGTPFVYILTTLSLVMYIVNIKNKEKRRKKALVKNNLQSGGK